MDEFVESIKDRTRFENELLRASRHPFVLIVEDLDHSHKYDWLKMLQEELADGLKYLQCEMERKDYVINLLKAGLRSDEQKHL